LANCCSNNPIWKNLLQDLQHFLLTRSQKTVKKRKNKHMKQMWGVLFMLVYFMVLSDNCKNLAKMMGGKTFWVCKRRCLVFQKDDILKIKEITHKKWQIMCFPIGRVFWIMSSWNTWKKIIWKIFYCTQRSMSGDAKYIENCVNFNKIG